VHPSEFFRGREKPRKTKIKNSKIINVINKIFFEENKLALGDMFFIEWLLNKFIFKVLISVNNDVHSS